MQMTNIFCRLFFADSVTQIISSQFFFRESACVLPRIPFSNRRINGSKRIEIRRTFDIRHFITISLLLFRQFFCEASDLFTSLSKEK